MPSVKDFNDLLKACTVRIVCGSKVGTGFFVAPGRVLTCAHVIENCEASIEPFWNGEKVTVEEISKAVGQKGKGPDVALITINNPVEHPCCVLSEEYPSFEDTLTTLGYTGDYELGDIASFKCEGGSNHPIDGFLLKTKDGQAYPGMSGAPLVNIETGKVCGVMLTERQYTATGGARAIPIQTVYSQWPAISRSQANLGTAGRMWREFKWPDRNSTSTTDELNSPSNVEALFLPPSFSGQTRRTQIIADLASKCSAHPILAVEGLSGSGKTFAVSEFVHDKSHSRYSSAYWYTTHGNETLDELLIQLGQLCQTSGTIEARCSALVRYLRQKHIVLVIDDFHAVNPTSYSQLVDSAAKSGNPATLILVSRTFVDAGRNWPVIGHLAIGGFGQSELDAYLRAREINLREDIVSTLHRKSDGLPLAASLFATLVGQFNEDPSYLLAGEMEHDSRLRSWFDELSLRITADEGGLLRALSVYDASFNRDVVKFLGEFLKIINVNQAFESLQRRYLVQRSTPYRWKVHNLIASFSSEELPSDARRKLSLHFADQSLKGIEIVPRRSVSEENVIWTIRAIRFFQRAERFDKSGRLLEKLAPVVKSRGFHNLFIPVAEVQLQRDDSSDDWIDYHLAHCYQITGQITKAFEISQRLVSLKTVSDKNKRLATLRLHAELLVSIHQYPAALRTIRDALSEVSSSEVDFTTYNHAQSIEVMILTKEREFKQAFDLAQKLLADSAKGRQVRGIAVAKMRLGLIRVEQREYGAALEYLDHAAKDFQECGDVRGEAWALTHESEVLFKLGQTTKAGEAFLRGTKLSNQIGGWSDEYRDLLIRVLELHPPAPCAKAARREIQRMTESASISQRSVF